MTDRSVALNLWTAATTCVEDVLARIEGAPKARFLRQIIHDVTYRDLFDEFTAGRLLRRRTEAHTKQTENADDDVEEFEGQTIEELMESIGRDARDIERLEEIWIQIALDTTVILTRLDNGRLLATRRLGSTLLADLGLFVVDIEEAARNSGVAR